MFILKNDWDMNNCSLYAGIEFMLPESNLIL